MMMLSDVSYNLLPLSDFGSVVILSYGDNSVREPSSLSFWAFSRSKILSLDGLVSS